MKDAVDKAIKLDIGDGGEGGIEDLDYNLPRNLSQLPLFQIMYVFHKISVCGEHMLALRGSVPDAMQTSSKRNRQNFNYLSRAVEQLSETYTEHRRGILKAMFMHKHYKANQRHLSSLSCSNFLFFGPINNRLFL